MSGLGSGPGATDAIVVGAPGDDDDESGAGAVYILFVNEQGSVDDENKISGSGGTLGTLAVDSFGESVGSLGDVDDDSVPDIAVGAHYHDDGSSDAGAVWVIFLTTAGGHKGHSKLAHSSGGIALGSLDDYSYFGKSVCGMGDLNGDSIPDIAVGATGDSDVGTNAGAVFIITLNRQGQATGQGKITGGAGGLAAAAVSARDKFGTSVAAIPGKSSGDRARLAVGAAYRSLGGTERGAVHLIELANLVPTPSATPSPSPSPSATPSFTPTPSPSPVWPRFNSPPPGVYFLDPDRLPFDWDWTTATEPRTVDGTTYSAASVTVSSDRRVLMMTQEQCAGAYA